MTHSASAIYLEKPMPDQIKDDLENILMDLRSAYEEAEDGIATLQTCVGASFQKRVERVSEWLNAQD